MGFSTNELALEILFTNFKDRIEFKEEKKIFNRKNKSIIQFRIK